MRAWASHGAMSKARALALIAMERGVGRCQVSKHRRTARSL
jgi:hypothetical protein